MTRTEMLGFNTLWIYTALKHEIHCTYLILVSIPSEFTLLSNQPVNLDTWNKVSIPSEFTLLSNRLQLVQFIRGVSIPSEFTLLSNTCAGMPKKCKFQYPLNLHCSQTTCFACVIFSGFNTLWIYTALKHEIHCTYLILVSIPSEFTLLSNQPVNLDTWNKVSIPSEFTLLSNRLQLVQFIRGVSIPSEFTLLSNTCAGMPKKCKFQYPLNLHCSQTETFVY